MANDTSSCDILLMEPSGGSLPSRALVPSEHCFMLKVQGEPTCFVACSPSETTELVYGRLLTEGLIAGIDDVVSVVQTEDGRCVEVMLQGSRRDSSSPNALKNPADRAVYACDTVGNMGIWRGSDDIAEDAFEGVCAKWSFEQVFELARTFAADTPMHHATSGSHSCTLVDGEGQRFCSEDIGRHNAMDKVIGKAMLERVDLSASLVFTSGRIPADMVSKVIRAGIPVLVSKGVPTDLGVSIAKAAGLVLVCAARPDSLKVFNDPRAS